MAGSAIERLHAGEVASLERREADDDVGDLHAGVVDVVLHLDRPALKAQQPHERVAERRVPQMADVRGLVRVDGGVLDDDLAAGRRAVRGRSASQLSQVNAGRSR